MNNQEKKESIWEFIKRFLFDKKENSATWFKIWILTLISWNSGRVGVNIFFMLGIIVLPLLVQYFAEKIIKPND